MNTVILDDDDHRIEEEEVREAWEDDETSK